jgi:hypothetical protein
MNTLKKIGYGVVAAGCTMQSAVFAAGNGMRFINDNVDPGIKGTDAPADVAIQTLINRATVFLAILAVVYSLWGGFQIMTAGGDDKKVSSGKMVIMHAAMGLVVIFLAWSIVSFILNLLFPSATGQ